MPNMEELKRMAQNAVYTAAEKAQEAAAAAGEKAGPLLESTGDRVSALREIAGEKAEAFREYAGEKAALMSERRALARNFQALGEWYAAHCGDNAPEAVADVIGAIRQSQAKIAALRGGEESADGASEN